VEAQTVTWLDMLKQLDEMKTMAMLEDQDATLCNNWSVLRGPINRIARIKRICFQNALVSSETPSGRR
jgi:hypothetical protein